MFFDETLFFLEANILVEEFIHEIVDNIFCDFMDGLERIFLWFLVVVIVLVRFVMLLSLVDDNSGSLLLLLMRTGLSELFFGCQIGLVRFVLLDAIVFAVETICVDDLVDD